MRSESKSESKSNPYERWPDNESYRLPDFPHGKIPNNIVLTKKAEKFFEFASDGQGLAGVAWLGKDELNNDILHLDLIPAFNAGDEKPTSDKKNRAYEDDEYVYTTEPLGGSTGIVHSSFMQIIEKRINQALRQSDHATLKQYEGTYVVSQDNECF